MENILKGLRKECLRISAKGKDGNLQSVFSSMEILWTLYNRVMRWSPEKAVSSERDVFVLSKGQSTLALHVVLAEAGLFKKEDLYSFCEYDSRFSMQADRTKFPEGGIEISAGSLGHGFPVAVGMALARKIRHCDAMVYVLAGDGEMNEGTMWEACAFAAGHQLDKLCLIIDDNRSLRKMLPFGCFEEKLKSFGFTVTDCPGHDPVALEKAVRSVVARAQRECRPSAVLAHTHRGYGCRSLMEDASWFHRFPKADELDSLLAEVDNFA